MYEPIMNELFPYAEARIISPAGDDLSGGAAAVMKEVDFHSSVCRNSESMVSEDLSIDTNWEFPLRYLVPEDRHEQYDTFIVMLHGLNERSWEKYEPWARRLCRDLQLPVILFPISFHMQRSDPSWSDLRLQYPLARERRDAASSPADDRRMYTAANAAISDRIAGEPQRSVFASCQAVRDLELLMLAVRSGRVPGLTEDSRMHLFGYSIGCTIVETLLMKDLQRDEHDRMFPDSRAVLFCGGGILGLTDPVRRGILDPHAHRIMDRFFDDLAAGDPEVLERSGIHTLNEFRQVDILSSLLRENRGEGLREECFSSLGRRLQIIGLQEDTVFPASCLEDFSAYVPVTMVSIPGAVHENPFAARAGAEEAEMIDRSFDRIFEQCSSHYRMD